MESELDFDFLVERANEKILLGNELIGNLDKYKETPGVQKIQRKINQEIKFLQKVINNETLIWNHIQCSNLTHYEFLVKILGLQRDIVHVDCGFSVEGRSNPIRVDIVCDNGLKWIKAIARSSKSLEDAAKGEASYGAKSILDQAEEYIQATQQHLCMFKQPKVVFYFSQRLENHLLDELTEIGIEIASLTHLNEADDNNANDLSHMSTLNLDITTMLAYISEVVNGGCNFVFREGILTEQAERERQTPLKPILDKLFENKCLTCCQIAYESFQDIVSVLAGPKERERALALMQRVKVFPDVDEIPIGLSSIKMSGKINPRSLKIFAFGMQIKALTVTSNKAFIRSAKMQGINVPVFTHQARALTEMKEQGATSL